MLLGTWHVWKQVDSQLYYINSKLSTDTTKTYCKIYTNFTSDNYIEFKSGTYSSSTVSIGNLGLQCIDNSYGLSSHASASLTGTKDSTFWFYDNVTLMQLEIGQSIYYITQLTNDSLVLWYNNGGIIVGEQYNYNWCFLHR